MASNTYNTLLKYKETSQTSGTFAELVAIKDFPDLGGSPELLETTTLKDKAQTYINGIQSMSSLEFTANYDLDTYKTIKALEGKKLTFQLWFGANGLGEDGIFEWQGDLVVWVTGKGVNEVKEMTISIAASTEIALKED